MDTIGNDAVVEATGYVALIDCATLTTSACGMHRLQKRVELTEKAQPQSFFLASSLMASSVGGGCFDSSLMNLRHKSTQAAQVSEHEVVHALLLREQAGGLRTRTPAP